LGLSSANLAIFQDIFRESAHKNRMPASKKEKYSIAAKEKSEGFN
jgi:hypothetical protein